MPMDTNVVMPPATGAESTRHAIGRLMVEYVHAIDNDEVERWPSFFTDDAVYRIIPRVEYDQQRLVGIWYCEGRGMLEDRVSALRSVNVYEPHVYRHVVGPSEVLEVAGGAYRAQTSYMVVRTMHDGQMVLFSAGRYVDEIVIENGAAKLRQRTVVTDSACYDTLVVIPL
jgi:anthranilate 1,2-dioxygenase small subunit